MKYQPHDFHFRRAKSEGYLARSVYKLQAIDQKYRLFHRGMKVVDLGAAPGSWTQYLLEKVGPEGFILAVDLQTIRLSRPNLQTIQMDVWSPELESLLQEKLWDAVISDMAPSTTGSRPTDQSRSALLVERSLFLAQRFTRRGGFWIAKLLEGPELQRLRQAAQQTFETVHIVRPPATRKGSTECFLLGLKKRL
ncbi:MAG: RlmE family RNA methyltransferase [Bacteroidia bacterium]|nr:RlmE family RNA methyltransferase [Bacteroidia bacterium]